MKATGESFPVSPSPCLGVLGCTGLASHKLSWELSVLLVCTLGALLGYGQGLAPPLQMPPSPLHGRAGTVLLSAETQLSNADAYSLDSPI